MSAIRTPDGRYIVVRGRLWRASDPRLDEAQRQSLVNELMQARRRVASKSAKDKAQARLEVDAAKRKLGERGPVWWTDGAPDLNRRSVKTSVYADWFARLAEKAG